jgi:hypothetical protein
MIRSEPQVVSVDSNIRDSKSGARSALPDHTLLESSVNKQHCLWWVAKTIGAALAVGISIGACAGLPGAGGTSWEEEVLLHDGSKIIATRSVSRGGRHEIGQDPPIREQSLTFTMPGTKERVTWEDTYSEDLGSGNFNVRLLDIFKSTAYVLASPAGCLSYNKWGRPNPPYVIFKYDGKAWQRIALTELPIEIKMPNLISSSPDTEVKKAGKRFMSAELVKQLNEGYGQPEYRSILRESIPNAGGGGCGEMVGNGKGAWEGIGWFKRQPSLDACLRYCTQRDFSDQYCPCDRLFKGK